MKTPRKYLLFLLTTFFLLLPVFSVSALDFSSFTVKGFEGKGPLEFSSPEDLLLDSSGRIIVADHRNNRIQVLTAEGDYLFSIPGTPPKAEASIETAEEQARTQNYSELQKIVRRPSGLALDKNGLLYVASFEADKIGIINMADGSLTGTIGRSGKAQGELNGPMDIAISPDGSRIAVAEFKGKRVQILAEDGKCLKELLYQEESKKGRFSTVAPRGVHWNTQGQLIVSYPTYNQIVCWEPMEGKLIWRYGSSKGRDKGQLDNPSFITDGKDGNLLIADTGNHRIVEITGDGKFFEHHGRRGSAPGRLISPRGMALTSDESLVISDSGNNRIHFFQPGQATIMLREIKQLALKDDWESAMPRIEKVLYLQPNNQQAVDLMVNGLYFFGNQAFNEKNYDKAEEYYRRVIRYRPDDPNIPQKLDAIFWAANQGLIATVIFGIIAIIVGLIVIWVLKVLISRFIFSKS